MSREQIIEHLRLLGWNWHSFEYDIPAHKYRQYAVVHHYDTYLAVDSYMERRVAYVA